MFVSYVRICSYVRYLVLRLTIYEHVEHETNNVGVAKNEVVLERLLTY